MRLSQQYWDWGGVSCDIGTVGLGGADERNLTALAGLGGLNCWPVLSPDGRQIAFRHSDPVEGEFPCLTGAAIWVINVDGTGLRRVTPDLPGFSSILVDDWTPDGYRLLCHAYALTDAGQGVGEFLFTIDSDGTDLTEFPYGGTWSRDGSMIADQAWMQGAEGGLPGTWRILRVTNVADGSSEDVFRTFISDAEVDAIIAAQAVDPAQNNIVNNVAPYGITWSPKGDRLAFCGAIGYDPYGPMYWLQTELWVLDLATRNVTRITNNSVSEVSATWDGHNTFPDDPEVTVNNTTVLFDEVLDDGLTTIIRDDDLPELPTGFMFAGESYRITTTATPSGTITVKMTYLDEFVPSGTEETLCIYHWDQDTSSWEDITVSRDPVNNLVIGLTDSLSPFGMVTTQRFLDILFSNWAYGYIEACVNAGIVSGYPDGTYRPAQTVTRDAMAVFISRALAGGDDLVPTGPPTATFTDVLTNHWAYKYVEYAADNGVVAGYDDGTYRPTLTVTRDAMAVFVARAMVGGEEYVPTGPATAFFPDVLTDHWAYKYVEFIRGEGVAGGYPDGTYRPLVEVTRDQMAVYVQRAFALPM